MRKIMIMATLLLAACGTKSATEVASGTFTDPETGETAPYSVATDENGTGNISIKTEEGEMKFDGGAGHGKLPDGISPYPGSRMTGGFSASGKSGTGGMASFEVKANAADVITHFRKQAESVGMKVNSELTSGDMMMIGAEKVGDKKTGMQVTATQAGDLVRGSVTYGIGG